MKSEILVAIFFYFIGASTTPVVAQKTADITAWDLYAAAAVIGKSIKPGFNTTPTAIASESAEVATILLEKRRK